MHAVYGDRNFHEGEMRDTADFVISEIREVIGVLEREE